MLELLLAILSLFVLDPGEAAQPHTMNSDTYEKLSSDPNFKRLFLNEAFESQIVISDENSKEDIIVTQDVDPYSAK